VAVPIVAAQGKLTPCEERGAYRRPRRRLVYLAVGKGQEAVFNGWKANRVGHVANMQRAPAVDVDPDALGAVLQSQGHAGLIVGDGSMHALAFTLIADSIAGQNPVHRSDRDGPRVDAGAFQNLHLVQRLDMKQDACLLHFVIENASLDGGQLHLRTEKVREPGWIVAVDGGDGLFSIHKNAQLSGRGWRLQAWHQTGGLDDGAYFNEFAIGLGANHLLETRSERFG
jgi:hypothetical protein